MGDALCPVAADGRVQNVILEKPGAIDLTLGNGTSAGKIAVNFPPSESVLESDPEPVVRQRLESLREAGGGSAVRWEAEEQGGLALALVSFGSSTPACDRTGGSKPENEGMTPELKQLLAKHRTMHRAGSIQRWWVLGSLLWHCRSRRWPARMASSSWTSPGVGWASRHFLPPRCGCFSGMRRAMQTPGERDVASVLDAHSSLAKGHTISRFRAVGCPAYLWRRRELCLPVCMRRRVSWRQAPQCVIPDRGPGRWPAPCASAALGG